MTRTASVAAATALALSLGAVPAAHPQTQYPSRPVRLVVTFPPGSGADIMARIIGQKLSDSLGQQFVIDNRAGASGIIGTELAARAAPDGYTIIMVTSSHTINGSVYAKLPYDPVRDLAPITQLASTPYLMVVHPSVPAKSVAEMVALAKSKPGQINYATGGIGVGSHLAGELLKAMAGIDIVVVPYKGAPQATADVVAGQVHMSFSTMPTGLPLVRAGKLRALAVTSAERVPATPEIPTIAESGVPGFEVNTWQGMLAPAATPRAIIARLNGEAVRALQQPDVQERLTTQGYRTVGNSPAEFAIVIKNEIAKWAKVVKAAGIKPLAPAGR